MSKDKSIKTEFKKAAEDIKKATDLSNDTLLSLYGYYKQAKLGDCNTDRPGMFDPKGRAKWDAWNANKDMKTEIAMKQYIKKVNEILDSN